MNNLTTIIFEIVVNFAMIIIFLRFMFQFAEIDTKHPYAKVTYNLSAVVTIFRRILPDLEKGRVSLAAIVLLLLLNFIYVAGMASITGKELYAIDLFFYGMITAILAFIKALKYIVFGSVICSWIILLTNKMHPVMDLLMQMAEPIIAPFRRFTPNMGMIDLSVVVALLSLSILEIFIRVVAENMLIKMGW